jgi:hypothetical protein
MVRRTSFLVHLYILYTFLLDPVPVLVPIVLCLEVWEVRHMQLCAILFLTDDFANTSDFIAARHSVGVQRDMTTIGRFR